MHSFGNSRPILYGRIRNREEEVYAGGERLEPRAGHVARKRSSCTSSKYNGLWHKAEAVHVNVIGENDRGRENLIAQRAIARQFAFRRRNVCTDLADALQVLGEGHEP